MFDVSRLTAKFLRVDVDRNMGRIGPRRQYRDQIGGIGGKARLKVPNVPKVK